MCACTYIHNIVNICNLNINIYIYNHNYGGRRPQGCSWATSPPPRVCSKAAAEPGSGNKSSEQSCSDTICSDISFISSTLKMMVI